MKILVLSDSHSALQFMRQCVESVKPDAIIHLGDFFDDGVVIHEENPDIPFYQVPGNCDRFRCPSWQPETLVQPVFGVNLFMTHGHRQNVKMGLGALLKDARQPGGCGAVRTHPSGRLPSGAGRPLDSESGKLRLRRRNGRSDSGGKQENRFLPYPQGRGLVISPSWQGKPWR